jgi:hypothetical protein
MTGGHEQPHQRLADHPQSSGNKDTHGSTRLFPAQSQIAA